MRKNAGLMILSLLLLIVPALANAWTLTVKVAGGTAAQAVTVAYQTSSDVAVTKSLKVGTNYLYPKAGVTFDAAGSPTFQIDGAVADRTAVNSLSSGPHTVTVTYVAAPVQYSSITLEQADGGYIYAQNLNNTWSSKGVSGYVQNAQVPVIISADANSNIVGYKLDGGATVNAPADAKKIYAFTVAANGQRVNPVFAVDAKISASLFAPTNGVAGTPITLSVAATTNTTGLKYAFSLNNGASFTTASTSASYTFTPSEGTVTVKAKVTSDNGGVFITPAATIVVANAQAVANGECTSCHSSQSPAIVVGYNASVHAKSAYSTCEACHTSAAPHSSGINSLNIDKSTFVVLSSAVPGGQGTVAKNAVFCTACHATPHILIEDGTCTSCHNQNGRDAHTVTYAKANHGGGKAAPSAGAVNTGDSITEYLTQGAICADCHNSTNSVLAGFAEGGHGHVSDNPMNPFSHYDWSGRANNGTRQHGNCDRCHTAVGFIKFAGQDADLQARLALQAGKPNNVLICVGCHSDIESGALRIDAQPVGNPTPLSGGYFALFSSASTSITAGNTKIEVTFPGYKNSSICIPCHSGRTTDKVFIETIARSAAGLKNYTTISTGFYQHAKNIGQTFIGKGAFEFEAGSLATVGASGHAAVQMGAADTQGPCVGCHYSKTGETHSLAVEISDATCSTSDCHAAGFSAHSYEVEEENYNAAVKALDALIRAKFNALRVDASKPLETERVNVRFGRFNKTAGQPADADTATKAYGAWYNWQLLTVWDKAAFVHNTNYARKIVASTIDYLDDGVVGNHSVEGTILQSSALNDTEKAAAADFINGGSMKVMDRHTAPSGTYKVQYNLSGSTSSSPVACGTCHNPEGESLIQAEARKAWAESGHGETTALPWIPASNHLWRNAGFSASYADVSGGSDCVRCHTPEGFAQFVDAEAPFSNVKPVASAIDAAIASPLTCNACHVNALDAASGRLAVPQVTIYYNISTAGVKSHLPATYPNVGESNMCIPCHAGRVSGASLADVAGKGFNFSTSSFQNSHYMAAAGLMYAKSGFTAFTSATTECGNGKGGSATYGQTMTSNEDGGLLTSTHRKLGTSAIQGDSHNLAFFVPGNLDTNGPCVTCHLQGYTNAGSKRPGAGHSLEIDAAAWNQVCNQCHSAEGPELVEEEKVPYDTALNVLKNLVQSKLNCEYDPGAYPYFFKAGMAHTTANAFKAFGNVKREGAAFNLNLLAREPYAYVHARTYTRRLIYDSIDYLDDNLMNQSVSAYLETLGTFGDKPADASGSSANDHLWQYLNGYNRTSKAWNAPLERP